MERSATNYLKDWLFSADRRPLIIRGARQVGKTWLVRHFAEATGKHLIEINFEKQPLHVSLFDSNDPKQILRNLATLHDKPLTPDNCLLFLDEIQAAPHLFDKLRWFAEDLPQLPVIAAGSLLEFLLTDHAFGMPVGRISYMHLEPLSFEEFLLASHKKNLYDYLVAHELKQSLPVVIHEQLMTLFREYILVGGMPAVVQSWVKERSFQQTARIQHDLIATYRDDFARYRGRIAIERLDEVMMSVPKLLGQKFVFSRVNAAAQPNTLKQVLNLLGKARICHRVSATAANGIPFQAELKEKYFKEIFLDTGLCSMILGLDLNQIERATDVTLINQGGIAEQVVGQLFRTIHPFYVEPALYYWLREDRGASAEVDYLIQHGSNIIPVEVKAGSTGTLKSLHVFMGLKKLSLALRINSDLPSITDINVKDRDGNKIQYTLLSIPFYLVGQTRRLLNLSER